MELFLLRHSEAGKKLPHAGKDRDRSLTVVGKEEIERVGKALAKVGLEFDVIASSPLKRAKDSAQIVNKALKRKGKVEEWQELSPEGSRQSLYRRLAELKRSASVLCVGHEPYLTRAVADLITGGDGVAERAPKIALKKGGLARVSIEGFAPKPSGELRWLLTPKQIRKLG